MSRSRKDNDNDGPAFILPQNRRHSFFEENSELEPLLSSNNNSVARWVKKHLPHGLWAGPKPQPSDEDVQQQRSQSAPPRLRWGQASRHHTSRRR